MTLELRPVGTDHAEAFIRATYLAFGHTPPEQNLVRALERFHPDFALGIFDRERIVATASAGPSELTLPAAAGTFPLPAIPAAAVTAVGVLSTHRRRGLLTQLMARQLHDLRERGYPVAVLLASESIIYGRFGYGMAQQAQAVAIERVRSTFRPEAAAMAAAGRLRMLDADEVVKLLPGVHDRVRRATPGELSRNASFWTWHVKDLEHERGGGGGRVYALHESDEGVADGWVSYRLHDEWASGGISRHRAAVTDLVASDPAARAALWRLVLDQDLVEEVTARMVPVDEPLKWMLADPRRVRTTEVADHMWVRVIDIPAALSARGYGGSERLVIEVTAPDPTEGGRFVLETGPRSGDCRAATAGEKAQLVLGLQELGAIYLGGVAPSTLAAAGRVIGYEPAVLAVADRVFAGPSAPFCSLFF